MDGRMKRLVFVMVVLLGPTLAQAQAVEKWTLKVYNAGAQAPLSTTDFLAGSVTCNVDPASIVVVSGVNPTRAIWDDPGASGKVCTWLDDGSGPLRSTPIGGSYEASLSASNSVGTSAESARVPFSHPGTVPSVPTGLRLGR
jgi:hypothetical protein